MDLQRLVPEGKPVIQAYGDMGFRISGERIEGAVLVFAEGIMRLDIAAFGDLGPWHLDPVLGREPAVDLLLIGCGERAGVLGEREQARLRAQNIAVEVMGTGAACRTLNFLMAEGRRVAALLLPVP